MKYLLILTLLGTLFASCSSRQDIPTEKPGIANVAPEGRLTETIPSETSPSLPIVTADPTGIGLTPVQGNTPASSKGNPTASGDWLTFTSTALDVTVSYPPDWSVADEAAGVTFTSPTGATILLKKETASPDDEFKIGNQYCTTRTNEHGQTADVCADNASFTYTATFSLKKTDGSTQRITLMTKNRTVGDVFEAMFNSLHPAS